MPVIGLNYTKIEAERTGTAPNTEINTTPKILDVKESKIKGLGSNIDALTIEFQFLSEFKPEIGSINILGTLVYQTNESKDILKEWKKNRKLTNEAQVEVVNHIFRKVSLEALRLADLMQLPPVINLPKLTLKKTK